MKLCISKKHVFLGAALIASGNIYAAEGILGMVGNFLNNGVQGAGNAVNNINVRDSAVVKLFGDGIDWLGKRGQDVADKVKDTLDDWDRQEKEEKNKAEQAINQARADFAAEQDANVKQAILARITELERAERERALAAQTTRQGLAKVQADILGAPGAALKFFGERAAAAQENAARIEMANVQAHHQKKANMEIAKENMRQMIAYLQSPTTMRNIVLTAGGIFALWHGSKVAAKIIQDKYQIPALVTKENTSLLPLKDRLYNFLTGNKPEPVKMEDAVFTPALAKRFADLNKAFKNIVNNGGYLPNVLIYGPPGTGKTLVATLMSRTAGTEFMKISGSSVFKLDIAEGIKQLDDVWDTAEKCTKKVLLVIDEAECLFRHRDKSDDNAKKYLTHLLEKTGTQSRHISVWLLTNKPGDLDNAALNRCDYKIEIDLPGVEQVNLMLKKYINRYLIESSDCRPPQTFWHRIGWSKPIEIKKVQIQPGLLTDDEIAQLARQLVGKKFAGRETDKLILKIKNAALATEDRLITREMINDAITQTLAEKAAEEAGFKK